MDMTVCAHESTVASLIQSAKPYYFGREYSAFGEGWAWRSFSAIRRYYQSRLGIHKVLIIRLARHPMVLEDYKASLYSQI